MYYDIVKQIGEKGEWMGVDPAFRLMRFPLDGELDFYLKN